MEDVHNKMMLFLEKRKNQNKKPFTKSQMIALIEFEAYLMTEDRCVVCDGTGINPKNNDLYCEFCGGMGRVNPVHNTSVRFVRVGGV